MGQSRTLLRKSHREQVRRQERGRRIKPGTVGRRVTDVSKTWPLGLTRSGGTVTGDDLGKEVRLHATKGLRIQWAAH